MRVNYCEFNKSIRSNRKLVHADYDALESGKTELHSLETVNNQMEDIINSYEG